MGDSQKGVLRVDFDRRVRSAFLDGKGTTDAGLLAHRETDEVLGLTEMADDSLCDSRGGSNEQHQLVALLRQSIYSRLAGDEDVNDAERLAVDLANQTRFQLFALAYNLANFLRRLALPPTVRRWSLTTLREKLVKIGAKVVRHAKYVTFQLAEVAVSRRLFVAILRRIAKLPLPETRGSPARVELSRRHRLIEGQVWGDCALLGWLRAKASVTDAPQVLCGHEFQEKNLHST